MMQPENEGFGIRWIAAAANVLLGAIFSVMLGRANPIRARPIAIAIAGLQLIFYYVFFNQGSNWKSFCFVLLLVFGYWSVVIRVNARNP